MPKEKAKEELSKKGFFELLKRDGVEILAIYEEPFFGKRQVFGLVPIKICQPTPFQREISPSHLTRLKNSIEKIGRFLDPIILVRCQDGRYWTPNGNHRLQAMKELGKEKITAIIIPEERVLAQILSLNTEKPHNIKEKSLEVIKMYRYFLAREGDRISEIDLSFEFEEPYFATLGIIYEKRERFSGASYVPFLKRIEKFLAQPLSEAIRERERRAKRIGEEVDPRVNEKVNELKEKGVKMLFLKQFLIAHHNPYRQKKKEFNFDEGIDAFLKNLARFDIGKLREVESFEEFQE